MIDSQRHLPRWYASPVQDLAGVWNADASDFTERGGGDRLFHVDSLHTANQKATSKVCCRGNAHAASLLHADLMAERWTNHIAYWRKKRELTQEGLAAALPETNGRATTKGTISLYESGERWASLKRVYEIAAVLRCSVSEILDGPKPPEALPSVDELARMIQGAMDELPVGVSYGDYPEAVASSLHDRLVLFQASGGFRDARDEGAVVDTEVQSGASTKPASRARPRTQ